jgi:hypothetical protein
MKNKFEPNIWVIIISLILTIVFGVLSFPLIKKLFIWGYQ